MDERTGPIYMPLGFQPGTNNPCLSISYMYKLWPDSIFRAIMLMVAKIKWCHPTIQNTIDNKVLAIPHAIVLSLKLRAE